MPYQPIRRLPGSIAREFSSFWRRIPWPLRTPDGCKPHPKLFYPDPKHYWVRVRELSSIIIKGHASGMSDGDAYALIGQLNLGTGLYGEARNARLEKDYCRWVPEALTNFLKPCYVILLGLKSILPQASNDVDGPCSPLGIDWKQPENDFPFRAYAQSNYRFRAWKRRRSDDKAVTIVIWPQHPSRAPMTNADIWRESGREFIRYFCR